MTRYTIQLSRAAEEELEAFVGAIAAHSVETAARWHRRLLAAMATLEYLPERCPLAPESEWQPGTRELYFGKRRSAYRILFVVRGDVVSISRIRRGQQEPLGPDGA